MLRLAEAELRCRHSRDGLWLARGRDVRRGELLRGAPTAANRPHLLPEAAQGIFQN